MTNQDDLNTPQEIVSVETKHSCVNVDLSDREAARELILRFWKAVQPSVVQGFPRERILEQLTDRDRTDMRTYADTIGMGGRDGYRVTFIQNDVNKVIDPMAAGWLKMEGLLPEEPTQDI